MKRLWAAAAFIAVIVATCSIGMYFIKLYSNGTVQRLEIAENAAMAKDIATAIETAEDVKQYWQKAEGILSIFASHNDISQISIAISRLKPLIQNGDIALFAAEINSIKTQINHITKIETTIDIH